MDGTFQLRPAAPFDFGHTLAALAHFSPNPVTRVVGAERWLRQAWRVADRRYVLTLRDAGSVEDPVLEVEGAGPLAEAERTALAAHLRRALALDLDLRPLERAADAAFEPVLRTLYGYHPVRFPQPFEAACWALVRQRTPPAFASASLARLVATLGSTLTRQGMAYTLFPDARELDEASRPALLAATNNVRKVERLVPTARAFAGVDAAWLERAPYDEVLRWLLGIHGVGRWSAEFVLLRGLGRYERVPWTDTGALPAISRAYAPGLTLARGSAREAAERYGWLQGAWLLYLKRHAATHGAT